MEKISVILPVFNSEKCLRKSIESVLNQTYSDIELIIIDDGSTDHSVKVIKQFMVNDSRISLLINKQNMGVSFSRNRGIENATGKYIAFIDADDKWDTDKLEAQMNYINKNKVQWVFSNYRYISKKKNYVVSRNSGKYDYQAMLANGNPIGLLTCLINIQLIGETRFKNKHHEDYIFWLEIAKKGYCAFNTGDTLATYSALINGISSNKLKSFFWTFNVYLHECKNLKEAIKLQINYVKNYFVRKE